MNSSAGDPGLAGGSARPEAALQLALDLTSLDDAAGLVARLAPRLSRIEVGTPLALAAGFPAIGRIRALAPPAAVIVADVKICDAGEKIARSAFAAGADVITVVAAAIDDTTWRGVLAAATERRGAELGRPWKPASAPSSSAAPSPGPPTRPPPGTASAARSKPRLPPPKVND